MPEQIDLEVAVLNDKIATLAGALKAVAADFPALIDPAATGRAAVRVVTMNRLTAIAALINTGLLTAPRAS